MLATVPLTIFLYPQTVRVSSFRYMLEAGIGAYTIAIVLSLVAVVRLVALYKNGDLMPWTAWARFITGALSLIFWVQLGSSLMELSNAEDRPPSIGIGLWYIFAGWELYNCYRAMHDARARP